MSGVKDAIVNLRQSEYNRIMNSCRRADNLEAGISRQLEQASSRLTKQMDSQLGQIQQRHNRFESAVSNMSGEMRRIEKANQTRLRSLANDFQKDLKTLDTKINQQRREYTQKFAEHDKHLVAHDRILEQHAQAIHEQRNEYISLIQQQGEHFAQALDEQRRELQGQINTIQEHIVAKEQHAQGQAQQWLQDTQALLNAIDESYNHQKFKPGELAKLRNELQIAENNIAHTRCSKRCPRYAPKAGCHFSPRFPTLIDQETHVALRILDNPKTAKRELKNGLRRLFWLNLPTKKTAQTNAYQS